MSVKFNHLLLIFILAMFSLLTPLSAQNLFQGEYVLVQYIAENFGFRSTMHYLITPKSDTSGTFLELFREQGVPDSGSFLYQQ